MSGCLFAPSSGWPEFGMGGETQGRKEILSERLSLHKRSTNHRGGETQTDGLKIHLSKKSTYLNLPSFPNNMPYPEETCLAFGFIPFF
jgi:hypothetical protein